MKTFVLALVAGAACGLSQGATIVVNQGAFSSGQGGEFNAVTTGLSFTPLALTNSGSFETFCLEKSENFTPGATYNVSIDTYASGGGVSGQDSAFGDSLDERTAYLYYAFITGGLSGYDYANTGVGRINSAGSLQNAIWYIEGEVATLDSADALAFYNASAAGIGQGIGLVAVANLFDNAGAPSQSQLIAVPTPGAFAAFTLAGLAAARRRRA